jgi:hypothetical protein
MMNLTECVVLSFLAYLPSTATTDGRDRRVDGREELATEAGTLTVVPRVCVIKNELRLWRETKRALPSAV